MLLQGAVSFLSLALFTCASPASLLVKRATPQPWTNFNDNGVFYPAENYTSWRTLYARGIQLPDLSVLLSWEDYDPNVPEAYWPIYRSTDGGVTFQNLSRVYDTVNDFGNWYQPFLYTLPEDFGGYAAGTILIAGTSTPRTLSAAYIVIYASEDSGQTWSYVSTVAYGAGPELVTNGDKAIWEPFLLLHNGEMICYYSDQRDAKHAQKLVYETSTDLKTWSGPTNVVAVEPYSRRPGMATVAYSPYSKKYVLTFEYCGGPLESGCPVYYKVAKSPLEFNSAKPHPITNNTSLEPNGSPYVIWTKVAGKNEGTFIMSGNDQENLYVNTDAANSKGWRPVNVGQWSAYSRSLVVIDTPKKSQLRGVKQLLILNGGNIGCSGSCYNYVADGVVGIPSYPTF